MSSFSVQVASFIAKAHDRADLVVRKTSLAMFSRVIMRSPVDTGRFRANWMPGIDTVPTAATEETDKSGGAAVARAAGIAGQAKAGDRVFLANSLPYALPLEYGHSAQAPSGMVGVTVQEFPDIVAQAAASAQQEVK